ncbi:hypothetical protein [Microbacterium halotolerans]|uniref:hypothetical protein n=1 Tax=Microbacterium halotolerans TaxID=246613 RepID=UPI0013C2A858|nr:hypothetical protein [Microbacterium halotolerans]
MSVKTRAVCERALAAVPYASSAEVFEAVWGSSSSRLTPRQAHAMAGELAFWADGEIADWILDANGPLHDVRPFNLFDLRVMMFVGESRSWAEAVRQRCYKLSEEIEAGVLPFDRPGPFIDEVLIGMALRAVQILREEDPSRPDDVMPREGLSDAENDVYVIGDDDWGMVFDEFDEQCRWGDWDMPIAIGHSLLPAFLAANHPFRWFDAIEPFGLSEA